MVSIVLIIFMHNPQFDEDIDPATGHILIVIYSTGSETPHD